MKWYIIFFKMYRVTCPCEPVVMCAIDETSGSTSQASPTVSTSYKLNTNAGLDNYFINRNVQ